MRTENLVYLAVFSGVVGVGGAMGCASALERSEDTYKSAGINLQLTEYQLAKSIGRPIRFDISRASCVVYNYTSFWDRENPCNLDIAALSFYQVNFNSQSFDYACFIGKAFMKILLKCGFDDVRVKCLRRLDDPDFVPVELFIPIESFNAD